MNARPLAGTIIALFKEPKSVLFLRYPTPCPFNLLFASHQMWWIHVWFFMTYFIMLENGCYMCGKSTLVHLTMLAPNSGFAWCVGLGCGQTRHCLILFFDFIVSRLRAKGIKHFECWSLNCYSKFTLLVQVAPNH